MPTPTRRLLATFAFSSLLLAHCQGDLGPPEVFVHTPDKLAFGTELAVEDLVADLKKIGGFEVSRTTLGEIPCHDGTIRIVVLGHEHDEEGKKASNDLQTQSFEIKERACGDAGRVWTLRGGSLLAAQWAVYAVAEQAGIRYLHPEETLYPASPRWPTGDISGVFGPSFQRRSFRVHRTHPIELDAPLDSSKVDMEVHQKRWIDWNVKMRQSLANGWDEEFVGDYSYQRGFPRELGFNLLNTQQGMRPVIDPDDERSDEEQVADYVDWLLRPVEGLPSAEAVSFQFNPSEFTEADHHETVRRLIAIADKFAADYPGIDLYTINHGTHQEPSESHGMRFFDLSSLAPGNLGVRVHTLMFYDLERPAPVYGNQDFKYLLDFAKKQSEKRRIVHYPESSWWLTFDLPVPLYLAPVTLEARAHDISLLKSRLSKNEEQSSGVYGHDLFTTGQEWGYWLIDWCVAQMTWDARKDHGTCIDEFTTALEQGESIASVLKAVTKRQVKDMRDPDLIRMLVGSDDATEAAFDAGIVFHPLPPQPKDVLAMSDEEAARFQRKSVDPLAEMAADYRDWARSVEKTLKEQSKSQAPFVREIHDGLRVFGLRAELAAAIYQSALDLRSALARNDLKEVERAHLGLEKAREVLEHAREVIHARAEDYRYPDALTIDGDEPGTSGAVENSTVYTYRYLSRTHRLFFWERPVNQLAELFGEGLERVRVSGRVLREGEVLGVDLLLDTVDELEIDYGDGTVSNVLEPHLYESQGIYDWHLNARGGSDLVVHSDQAAIVARRYVFPKGSLKVEEPAAASLIAGLIPGMEIGLGKDSAEFLVLGNIEGSEPISAQGSLIRRSRKGNSSGPEDLKIVLRNVGQVRVRKAIIEVRDDKGPKARRLEIRGEMVTEEIIDLLVQVGGFEKVGARALVADILGATPETLPEAVPFLISAKGVEDLGD